MNSKRSLTKKQGSALVLTVLTLAFLLVLLCGVNLDRNLRYWISSHRRDEMVSFFNAQSAHEIAESNLYQHFVKQGSLAVNFTGNFTINSGISRYLWILNDEKLSLQGIGIYNKSYSLLQSDFQSFQSSAEDPLVLIIKELSGEGSVLLNHDALYKGIYVSSSSKQLKSYDGTLIHCILHSFQENSSSDLTIDTLAVWNLLSLTDPVYEKEGFFVETLSQKPLVSDLLNDHIYLAEEFVQLDVRECEDWVEIPSLICKDTLEILLRPEQIVRFTGLLYCSSLKISQGTISFEPSALFLNWFQSNHELLNPANYQSTPQLILARKEYRFLPQRAVGE